MTLPLSASGPRFAAPGETAGGYTRRGPAPIQEQDDYHWEVDVRMHSSGCAPTQFVYFRLTFIADEASIDAMKDAVIRARIDAGSKAYAAEAPAACGREDSEAQRLFIGYSRIPFPIQGSADELLGAELAKLKPESQWRDRRIAAAEDVSGGEMFLIRPDKARAARIRWPDASLV